MKKLTVFLVLLCAAAAFSRGFPNLPRGKWWQNEKVVADLGLTPEQRAKLDDIMFTHRDRMIDLKAALEKAELRLKETMDKPVLNEKEVLEQLDKSITARGLLQKDRITMLVKVRGVLTPEQWAKAKVKLHERMEKFGEKRRGFREFRREHRGSQPEGPAMHRGGGQGERAPGGPEMANLEDPGQDQPEWGGFEEPEPAGPPPEE